MIEVELQVNVRDHPMLLTEIGLMPRKHREKLTEVRFLFVFFSECTVKAMVKALLSPQGAYLISDLPKGVGLNREEGLLERRFIKKIE